MKELFQLFVKIEEYSNKLSVLRAALLADVVSKLGRYIAKL
ncbi:hypothetical protein [Chroococcidiopsis sp.]